MFSSASSSGSFTIIQHPGSVPCCPPGPTAHPGNDGGDRRHRRARRGAPPTLKADASSPPLRGSGGDQKVRAADGRRGRNEASGVLMKRSGGNGDRQRQKERMDAAHSD